MTYPIIRSLFLSIILFLNIVSWVIVANSLLSFFMDPKHRIRVLLGRITNPILAPFRLLTRRMGPSRMPLDFSPMLALIAIWILISIIERFSAYLYRIIYLS